METVRCDEAGEENVELEDQFILRLPQPQAEVVRTAIKELKPKKFKKLLNISLENNKRDVREGTVKIKKKTLPAKLVDLPCIIDSYKTVDKAHLFKTAGINQILICHNEKVPDNDDSKNNAKTKSKVHAYPHGITPPLKNVKKQRFRKVLKNKENFQEVAEVEKEVMLLLRADNEAVSTRFEIHYEQPVVNECAIFGEVISDSDSDQESPVSSAKGSAVELLNSVECPN